MLPPGEYSDRGVTQPPFQSRGLGAGFELVLTIDTYLLV